MSDTERPTSKMGEFYDSQAKGLAEVILVDGGTFQWRGATYKGMIDHATRNITTLKSYFPTGYPKCGDNITVSGRPFQIIRRSTAELRPVGGGFVEDPPFIDDPADPSLDLTFGIFNRAQ